MTNTKTAAKTATKTTVLTKDQIALQRGFYIPQSALVVKPLSKQERYTIQAELMQFGYMLSEDALDVVTVDWFQNVIPYLRKALGVGNYMPFYMNFPRQVMELSHAELFWNAIRHYYSEGTWSPSYELKERGFAFENVKFSTIKLGSEDEFAKIFTTLVSINQSITENDKNVVEWFVENYSNLVMPNTIPFKETLCMLAGYGLAVPVKTATDVLRIAVYFSGGDISMPALPKVTLKYVKQNRREIFYRNMQNAQIEARDKFKFKNLTRSKRKYLLALLENTNLDLGEMKLKHERWLRLGEVLHVFEYKNRFPKAAAAFDAIRNKIHTVQTFESKIETALNDAFITEKNEDLTKALHLIAKRPGVFARKLDYLLRTFNQETVLREFRKIAKGVSRKVLWELYNHFLKRDSASPRSIMLKGKSSKKKMLPELPPMNKILINRIQNTILDCLGDQFASMEKMGSVFIDEKLKKIPLPTAMRSINTAVKTYVRGTRVPFNETAKVIRPYIHWFDQHGDEDLDLSVLFFDKNLGYVEHISYTNLKSSYLNSCHSGDVRRRQGACAEYVDIDIKTCLKGGVRFALVQVHNFQNRPMHTMKDCVFGLMERQHPESNPIFVPKTITNAVAVANESSTVFIAILDLETKEYIWLDCEAQSRGLANLESTSKLAFQLVKDAINNTGLSVYDLLYLHATNRGVLVDESQKDKADTVFEYDDFVTSYDKVATYM